MCVWGPAFTVCIVMQVLSKSQKKRMKKKASAAKAAAEQDDSGEENEVANGTKTAADHEGEEAAEEGDGGEGGDAKKKKKKKKKGLKQTEPPTVPLAKFFPNGRYPEGEWQSYNDRYDATLLSLICSWSRCLPETPQAPLSSYQLYLAATY